ncbi:hypothetical protein SAMN04488038_10212 [Solimonas aquatica]|uniref:Uncharacterized protein n=1 Tax=Solimonas aquatica TaxID=489703 RepID=A0A1H9BB13_9GAMM|nr:hypothetical protein [Solimonas aquatica]SEP85853.1 hypothetical protein SAMN04488038_10212 [Solimonas aquatica]
MHHSRSIVKSRAWPAADTDLCVARRRGRGIAAAILIAANLAAMGSALAASDSASGIFVEKVMMGSPPARAVTLAPTAAGRSGNAAEQFVETVMKGHIETTRSPSHGDASADEEQPRGGPDFRFLRGPGSGA